MRPDDDWQRLREEWAAGRYGPIVAMCELGLFIDAAASAGDPVAIEMLQRMRPRIVPPAVQKVYRDRDFNKLADYLRRRLPGIKLHPVAVLIEAIGGPLGGSPPRSLARDSLVRRKLPADEITPLAAWIAANIRWIKSDDWHLSVRQISTIIFFSGF